MQTDLFGNPAKRHASYWVFHDESITMPNKHWFLIGLLFVREGHQGEALQWLHHCRQQEGYFGEIHFSELPGKFEGPYGAKARVARCWLQEYERGLAEIARFTALAVDRHSSAFEHGRFPKEYHAYNRFTAMALKAGISWFLGPENWESVAITFVSDKKDRMSRPDQGWVDNFENYLPYRAELDASLGQMQGKRYLSSVKVQLSLQDSAQSDLLQLCDVLLGATQMALVGSSSRATRQELGQMVVRWCRDPNLRRKFDLWAFPNEKGAPYSPVPLRLRASDNQPRLF